MGVVVEEVAGGVRLKVSELFSEGGQGERGRGEGSAREVASRQGFFEKRGIWVNSPVLGLPRMPWGA